ncbi:hypothetical protein [Tepidibacillus decaturensis]|uniref:Uncharacterized protein n=1 Tax=Tepidibacillus decaturensis TaxID=1413211 RepID=A0A135L487_9BACI|nr:hypothetical protein [Tepidibacillus decaturensis]KXG43796.1 hypothetical protein U473_07055 [Tepidibacillus decaturensis]
MDLRDAIFNWIQITVVHKARPEDHAAKDTSEFFKQILIEDHKIEEIRYERDPFFYTITYRIEGKEDKITFGTGLVDKLLEDIENEPKYNL